MPTFVRRVPADFDTTYWRVSPAYMEPELGAVGAEEAVRHESPKGFVSVAGETSGQAKDQSYCFAPYDGLRGLGMPDFHEGLEGMGTVTGASLGQMLPPAYPGGPIPLGEAPSTPPSSSGQGEGLVMRALPYVVAAAGLLWLLKRTAEETAPG